MRKRVLVLAAVLGAAGLVVPKGHAAIKLTYANFPPAKTFPSVQMERWAKEVEKRTGGKVRVKTFPGSTLLGAKNMLDGVIDGVADIGCFVFAYQPGRFPLLAGMDLPVGFPNAKVANAVLWDLYQKYKPASLKKVKVLALFVAPPADIMSKDPIRTLDDLKGYELRCTGAGVRVLKLLGATPVAMPMSETPEALQKGIVKGVFSSMDILKDFKFVEFCKYGTVTQMQTASFAVVMNMDRWKALPEDVKQVMEDMARDHSLWVGEYIDNRVKESIEWSKENYGFELIRLSDAEYRKWHEKVQPIIDDWVQRTEAKGLPGKSFLQDLYELKRKYEAEFGAR